MRRWIPLVAVAAAAFAVGYALRPPSAPPPPPSASTPPAPEAPAPRIVFDPSKITLMPDASLTLTLPAAPLDGGSSH